MKPNPDLDVPCLTTHVMDSLLNFLVVAGGALAAAALGVMCGFTLLVWFAGCEPEDETETWRRADER
jgi:hypothetical protein